MRWQSIVAVCSTTVVTVTDTVAEFKGNMRLGIFTTGITWYWLRDSSIWRPEDVDEGVMPKSVEDH